MIEELATFPMHYFVKYISYRKIFQTKVIGDYKFYILSCTSLLNDELMAKSELSFT